MALSHDVRLPKDQEPRFPERCVSCGRGEPEDSYRVGTNAIGWWTFTSFSFGRRFVVEAPACVPCADAMGRQRWRSRGFTLVLTILAVAIALSLFGDMEGPARRYVAMGVMLLVMAPYILVQVFWPPVFDVTAFKRSVDFEFANLDYAHEFAELNDGEVS
ncbi:MAG: hypothetical protein P1V81_04690 [Planctomycetota bacterium]|nr:hypothetical protein [Planctomycetota bacterium]